VIEKFTALVYREVLGAVLEVKRLGPENVWRGEHGLQNVPGTLVGRAGPPQKPQKQRIHYKVLFTGVES
jgi:hypothetical protein